MLSDLYLSVLRLLKFCVQSGQLTGDQRRKLRQESTQLCAALLIHGLTHFMQAAKCAVHLLAGRGLQPCLFTPLLQRLSAKVALINL